ncbi:MAG: NAD-dependent epimerase/dehydratase family protein [Chloroflexi bacterium]|nr:NAD-dependent epimerase/dehydratase family protein [Chloroflexota bacterium]
MSFITPPIITRHPLPATRPTRYNIPMQILVTGATGFIGRSVMNRLERCGCDARPYHGRITDALALRAELEGIHTVIHLASAEGRGRARLLQQVDIDGTERLLDRCRRADVQRFIYLSRLGAVPNSLHPLLGTKDTVERMVRKSGLNYTILRSATAYGPGDRHFEMIASLVLWSWPLVWLPGGGRLWLQPIWVEDVARCLVLALDRPDLNDKTIAIAGEERLPYRAIVGQMMDVLEIRRIPLPVPLILLRPITRFLFSWWYWPPVSNFFVDRFFVPEVADFDSVLRQFGYRPASLAENLNYLGRPGLRWRIFRR